jgi:hypothetical protein
MYIRKCACVVFVKYGKLVNSPRRQIHGLSTKLREDDPTQGKEERSLLPAESVILFVEKKVIDVREGIKTASGSSVARGAGASKKRDRQPRGDATKRIEKIYKAEEKVVDP